MRGEIEIPINLTNLQEALEMARELNQLLDSAKAKVECLEELFSDFRIPADIDESMIWQNIRRIRKEQGLTQKELGERCGIADANIRKYESGRQIPKIQTIQKIANALNVPMNEIYSKGTLDADFGSKVKRARERVGISQKTLGERLGVTQQTVAQYESTTDQPKMNTVRKIADALGIQAKELME